MDTLILILLLGLIAAVTFSLITTVMAVLRGEPIPWFDAWTRATTSATAPGKALKQEQADADELHRLVAGLQGNPDSADGPDDTTGKSA